MTPRERVLATLRHERTDRVATALFGAELNGPNGRPIDGDDARDRLGVDVRIIRAEPTVAERSFQAYLNGLPPEVFVGDLDQLRRYHAWGYRPELSNSGSQARNPLHGAEVVAAVSHFAFPDFGGDEAYRRLEGQVRGYHRRGLAVFGIPPRLGGVLFEAAWRLRGFEAFLCDLIEGNAVTLWLLDRLTELTCHHAAVMASAGADVLYLGDDVAQPSGLLVSPALWGAVFGPRYRQIIATAKAIKPDMHICYHSDGNFTELLDPLVAIGVDTIEPVQPDCMDRVWIKQRFGCALTLVGCAGTADLFGRGSVEQIRAEVGRCLDTLSGDRGGLILAPAYDLMACTLFGHVEAFFEAARGRAC